MNIRLNSLNAQPYYKSYFQEINPEDYNLLVQKATSLNVDIEVDQLNFSIWKEGRNYFRVNMANLSYCYNGNFVQILGNSRASKFLPFTLKTYDPSNK